MGGGTREQTVTHKSVTEHLHKVILKNFKQHSSNCMYIFLQIEGSDSANPVVTRVLSVVGFRGRFPGPKRHPKNRHPKRHPIATHKIVRCVVVSPFHATVCDIGWSHSVRCALRACPITVFGWRFVVIFSKANFQGSFPIDRGGILPRACPYTCA